MNLIELPEDCFTHIFNILDLENELNLIVTCNLFLQNNRYFNIVKEKFTNVVIEDRKNVDYLYGDKTLGYKINNTKIRVKNAYGTIQMDVGKVFNKDNISWKLKTYECSYICNVLWFHIHKPFITSNVNLDTVTINSILKYKSTTSITCLLHSIIKRSPPPINKLTTIFD